MTRNATPGGQGRAVVVGLLFAILMIATALRFYHLDGKSLWRDEIFTAGAAQLDVASIIQFHIQKLGHPPLLSLITHAFFVCWGQSDFIARLPPALFGSLSVLLLYKVGEILWTRKEGLIGAFLLAVNAYHVQYSQEARHYSLMVFLALLSLVFLLKALERNDKRLWIGFLLFTSLGLYNHYFAFLLLPAEVILGAWVIAESSLSHGAGAANDLDAHLSLRLSAPARKALPFLLSLCVIGIFYLPWLSPLHARIVKDQGYHVASVGTAIDLELARWYLGEVANAHSGAQGATLLVLEALFLLGLATCGGKRVALLLLWIGMPFVFLSVVETEHLPHPRYVLFILPLCLLAVAAGITYTARLLDRGLRRMKADRRWLRVLIAALSVVMFGSLSLAPLREYYLSDKPDYRSVAQYLQASMRPGDLVLADGEGYNNPRDDNGVTCCLPFYLAQQDMGTVPVLPVKWRLRQAIVQNLGEGKGAVWAVVFHPRRQFDTEERDEISVVDFQDLSIIRLGERSGNLFEDTTSLLQVLVSGLSQPEARFDVHLALAGIYVQMGKDAEAAAQVELASSVMPHDPQASADLASAYSELKPFLDIEDLEPLSVGHVLAPLGYNVHPRSVPGGATLYMTLWWQTMGKMDRDYTVFIHLLGSDDRLWAQQDRLLQYDGRPTSTWDLGGVVSDEYELRLPSNTPPGQYTIKTGIYYWSTGERLPVLDENGQRVAGDTISLGSVTVRE